MMLTAATPLEAALSYAQLGWPVVPLHTPIVGVCDCPKRAACISPGKHPRTMRGVDDATTDLDKIRLWWGPRMWPQANIGVDLIRAGLLDVAPDSIQWQAEFIAQGLPRTASFRSGGGDGHEHHLYQRPGTCPAHRLCKTDEYDILSAGYAVMPPSLHSSGAHYDWLLPPDTAPPAPGPEWAVVMLQNAVRVAHPLNGTNSTVDVDEAPVTLTGEALERWEGRLVPLKANGTVNRSLALVLIGQDLARAGASRSAIRRALQERDETLGWSKYVGRRDANRRYDLIAQTAIDGRPSPRLIIPASPALTVPTVRRFKLLTAAELKARPDPEWLVEGVVQRDTLLLIVGAQETFKTFLALDMALSIGEGESWHGRSCKPGTAVYVSAEGGSGLGLRVQAWEVIKAIDSQGCFFLADQAPQFLDRGQGGDVDELLLTLADLTSPPAFIVVDTLARVMVGHDENSAEDMGILIATADRIRQASGATVALVHHNNRQGSARGSSALLGAVHTIIECSREANSAHVVVKCGKQKDADHFDSLMLTSRTITLATDELGRQRTSLILEASTGSVLNQLDRRPLTPTSTQALVALIELQTAVFSAWRDAAGLTKTTFHRTRQELIEGGYVDHLSDGSYRPTAYSLSLGPPGSREGPADPRTKGRLRVQKMPYVVEGILDPKAAPDPTQELGPEQPWV